MKKLLFFLVLALMLALPASAEADAVKLTLTVTASNGASTAPITDQKDATVLSLPAGTSLTLTATDGAMAGIYLIFDKVPADWTGMTDAGVAFSGGAYGFLHEYVALPAEARAVTLTFPTKVTLTDVKAWTAGKLPDHVQVWLPPYERADLLLLSTHSDDEHLFFAGLLPTCIDRGISAQVIYMTQHFDNHARPHEQLSGLWAVGVRHYPIVGPFPDLYSTSLAAARTLYAGQGYDEADFIAYFVEQIRRFKPQVVVGHDVNGEYNHGAHIVNTAALQKALEVTADATAYPDSAAKWGVWDVPKTYLHLWPERKVVLDYDTPLAAYGGKTAFQISNLGYDQHYSQHWTWFTRWLRGTATAPITAASQIATYSPCAFGLYRTTVGDDPAGVNDLFANLIPYAEQTTAPPETTAPPPPESTAAPETTAPASVTPSVVETTAAPPSDSAPVLGQGEAIPVEVLLGIGSAVIFAVAIVSAVGSMKRR